MIIFQFVRILALLLVSFWVAASSAGTENPVPTGAFDVIGESSQNSSRFVTKVACDPSTPLNAETSKCLLRRTMIAIHWRQTSAKPEKLIPSQVAREWNDTISKTEEFCANIQNQNAMLVRKELSRPTSSFLSGLVAACESNNTSAEQLKALKNVSSSNAKRLVNIMAEVETAGVNLSNSTCTIDLEPERDVPELVKGNNGNWTAIHRISRSNHCDRIERHEFAYDSNTKKWAWVMTNELAEDAAAECSKGPRKSIHLTYRQISTVLLPTGCRLLRF
jgi:hypothetical protein